MQIVGNEAFFTKEEEDRIDRLLAEVDEEQKRNGNKGCWIALKDYQTA